MYNFHCILLFIPLFSFFQFSYLVHYQKMTYVKYIFFNYLISIIYLIYLLFDLIKKPKTIYIYLYNWLNIGFFKVNFTLIFDSLSLFMSFLVLVISFIVHIYSLYYMENDKNKFLFFSYLSLFTFFMLLFIFANNLILMLFGWEGIGLCSYLLISFWNTRIEACKAALKAIVLNRIGDCFFLIGIALVAFLIHSVEFSLMFVLLPYFSNTFIYIFSYKISILNFIMFCFFMAAICKSAQFGFHVWLVDAMEGPTPVSALIHAATMVTAGIYLILRLSFLFDYTPFILNLMSLFGVMTILFASTVGLFQNDIKKIIAYSTCSQLGYMLTVCGFSGYNFAFFHLISHGFFKALLFLSAGLIIHNFKEEQDIRKMGGLLKVFRLTYVFFFIGSFSLIGFPFLTGYYSKDFLLEYIYTVPTTYGNIIYHLCVFSVILTSIYSFRLIYLVFIIKPNGYKSYYNNIYEYIPLPTLICLMVLVFLSIFFGYFFSDLFVGFGSFFFSDSLSTLNMCTQKVLIQFEYYSSTFFLFNFFSLIKLLPFFFSIIGIFLTYVFFIFFQKLGYYLYFETRLCYSIYYFFNQGWLFNHFYINILVDSFFSIIYFFFLFDKVFLENIYIHVYISILNYFSKIQSNFLKYKNILDYLINFVFFIFFILLIINIFIF